MWGQSALRLEREGRRLGMDPGTFSDEAALEDVEAVLITHLHPDHVVPERVARAVAAGAKDVWAPEDLVPQLAAAHRVVVMDHRGIGESTLGRDPEVGTRGFAADAVAVLDAAGVDAAHVYGHSMGGRVAQWMALDAPERVASLVLVGSTPGDAHGPARQKQVSRALAGGDAEQMGPLFFTGQFLTAHPDVARDFFAREASVTARRVHFQASTGHDTLELQPQIGRAHV